MPLPAGLWEGGIRKNGRVALTDSTSSNSNTDAKRATRKKDESGGTEETRTSQDDVRGREGRRGVRRQRERKRREIRRERENEKVVIILPIAEGCGRAED
jgi:hypothetical protein